MNNIDGPLTNPSQTAINPTFSIPYFDRQRNAGFSATWTPSARFTSVEDVWRHSGQTARFLTRRFDQPQEGAAGALRAEGSCGRVRGPSLDSGRQGRLVADVPVH